MVFASVSVDLMLLGEGNACGASFQWRRYIFGVMVRCCSNSSYFVLGASPCYLNYVGVWCPFGALRRFEYFMGVGYPFGDSVVKVS